jgi:hypothetical protein
VWLFRCFKQVHSIVTLSAKTTANELSQLFAVCTYISYSLHFLLRLLCHEGLTRLKHAACAAMLICYHVTCVSCLVLLCCTKLYTVVVLNCLGPVCQFQSAVGVVCGPACSGCTYCWPRMHDTLAAAPLPWITPCLTPWQPLYPPVTHWLPLHAKQCDSDKAYGCSIAWCCAVLGAAAALLCC